MPKYFYTDPLKAVWMARKFGFKYLTKMGADSFVETYGVSIRIYIDSEEFDDFKDNFILHPDCHEMLKPQIDDLILYNDGRDAFKLFKGAPRAILEQTIGNLGAHNIIIQRNGKAFFMPETSQ